MGQRATEKREQRARERARDFFLSVLMDAVHRARGGAVMAVQVGANDGKMVDPLYRMFRDHGWSGVLVEPHPAYFQDLSRLHHGNPRVRPVNCGISDRAGVMRLYHLNETARVRYPDWLRGCASLSEQRMQEALHVGAGQKGIAPDVSDIDSVEITLIRLDELLAQQGVTQADVLVVDVEGHELPVLNSADLASFGLSLVIVECNGLNLGQEREYVQAIAQGGFKVFRLGDDLIGMRPDLQLPLGDVLKLMMVPVLNAPVAPAIVVTQPSDVGIPRVLGHIWIGDRPAPAKWMQSWYDLHPDWQHVVYDNDFLTSRVWRNQALINQYFRQRKFAGVSDLMRYEILLERGGFMPEADSICLLRVDELFSNPGLYTVYENEKEMPGYVSPFLAASPGQPFLHQIIEHIRETQKPETLKDPWKAVGNRFLKSAISNFKPSLTIYPSHYFNPEHYLGEHYAGAGPIYARQIWGTTMDLYENHPADIAQALYADTLMKLEANLAV